MPEPALTSGIDWHPVLRELSARQPDLSVEHRVPRFYRLYRYPGIAGGQSENLVLFHKLQLMVDRQRWIDRPKRSSEEEERAYSIPLVEGFHRAAQSYPSVEIDPDVMAGAPCMKDTRIPVYMVLDAIEYHGSLEGGVKSYPRLTMAQIKDAIGFAKLVVECPLVDEAQTAS